MAPAQAMASANQNAIQAAGSLNLTTRPWRLHSPISSARKISTQRMKPAQCHGVISTKPGMAFTPLDARRRRVLHRHLRAADGRAFAFMQPHHQRAGDVDARIRAGEDADEEGEREVVDDAPAKNVKRRRG